MQFIFKQQARLNFGHTKVDASLKTGCLGLAATIHNHEVGEAHVPSADDIARVWQRRR